MTNSHPPTANEFQDDLLWRHLKTVPAFRALLRAVEARFYQHIDLPEPILDLGCGDGHFAQITFAKSLAAGVDPWWGPLQKAHKTGQYELLAQSLGDQLPFPDNHFATVISNSVLEHIPDVQPVLNEANRVLQPEGKLVITMPSHLFTRHLGGAGLLERVGANGLADRYRHLFNAISRHAHTDPPDVWAERLAEAGFVVERWQYYFSPEALHALEWGHIQGLPSAVLHFLTGHWIIGPWEDNLRRTERWVRPYFEEPFPPEGAYLFFAARKRARHPITANLPAARPFSIAELVAEKRKPEAESQETTRPETPPPPAPSPQTPIPRPQPAPLGPVINPRLISASLIIISLFCAITGQAILNTSPPDPGPGLRWYGYSFIPLLILAWRQGRIHWPNWPRWERPRWGQIPRQRWYFFLASFLAFLAPRVVGNPTSDSQPGLALMLWIAAGGIAFFALQARHPFQPALRISRFSILASAVLFLAAFILRTVDLTSHPFILNGIEASIGLDVLHVVEGSAQNPFAVGWLSNPTLLYFLLALPVRLLGPSVLSIRLLSPLAGALTVTAVFWLGQRLWNREVGLLAAIILLGSHFHLQYSRLGMTNIWDPLLALLALGLLAAAWQQNEGVDGRFTWLLAGVATGLNAYVFTGSHLLPLILILLALLVLLFDREPLRRQWRHILAAGALALIVALPQVLYYRNHPGVFMERANVLGILDGQTGWLSQEAARTGQTPAELLGDQFRRALLSFNYSLDRSGVFKPERPLLGFGVSILFVSGISFALVRLRQFKYAMLLSWVIIPVIFAGALLLESPSSHRLIITAPALALLAAIGLAEIGRFVGGEQVNSGPEAVSVTSVSPIPRIPTYLPILLAIAMLLAILDISFYFGAYRQQHSFGDRNTEAADNMADYLNTLGEDWTAYFYGPPVMYISFPTIPFLVADFKEGVNLFDVEEVNNTPSLAPTTNQTYIFLPERFNEVERIKELYPNGRLQTFNGFHADPLFYVYEVKP